MKPIITQLSFVFILFILTGCNSVSSEEHQRVLEYNEILKKEIELLKYDPGKMLKEAKLNISSKKENEAIKVLENLLDKYSISEEAKEAQTILDKLTKKKRYLAELKEKEHKNKINKAVRSLRKKVDDMSSNTWYQDKSSPIYLNRSGFFVYMGTIENSSPWLRLKIQYFADDWLFIEKYIIKADDQIFTITEKEYNEIQTDNGDGNIWEWLDRKVSSQELIMLKKVSESKNAKIRFEGKQYRKDKIITSKQKKAIKNMLDAYEALGGKL